eukprot:CAMPEP_0184855576 /NCGR_PEP_ID=MMETSP0580-20130426/780_1 /TAXON_ID=1118495 /ORGANISM="Dactyliosolen fragilissimus" /LENGTH=114 /DNA_ID=CAMNT_0027350125 /DNA_START=146 /DNA_END=490 /DNA_ORIENTATION=+
MSVENTIKSKLSSALNPTYLEVINESFMHNVPKNSETHFKVLVASDKFIDCKTLQRHRMVNSLLSDEIASEGPIHALSMVCKTPQEWDKMVHQGQGKISPSPKCQGGDGSLPTK